MVEFQDANGSDVLTIAPFRIPEGQFARLTATAVDIAPHQVPAVCRAIYAAAGLDVPDLPPILDPAEVEELAREIHLGLHGVYGCPDNYVIAARAVLSAGWKRGEL